MSEPRRSGRTTRPSYLFATAGLYVIVAVVWFVIGFNGGFDARIPVVLVWLLFAAVCFIRGLRQVRRLRAQE
jgi:uncharacterized membrane protein YhaH (DUF805 family)